MIILILKNLEKEITVLIAMEIKVFLNAKFMDVVNIHIYSV